MDANHLEKKCPDISTCRARQMGVGSFVYCMSDKKLQCDYMLNFGNVNFCLHPQKVQIAARSAHCDEPLTGIK